MPKMSTTLIQRASSDSRVTSTSRMLGPPITIQSGLIRWLRQYIRLSRVQGVKGPGCALHSFNGLSLDDFISSGSVAAHHHLKRLSLAPYYVAQMKWCMQKWDRRDNQGPNSGTINTHHQLVGIVGTSLYHSMVDVQSVVRSNCGSILTIN